MSLATSGAASAVRHPGLCVARGQQRVRGSPPESAQSPTLVVPLAHTPAARSAVIFSGPFAVARLHPFDAPGPRWEVADELRPGLVVWVHRHARGVLFSTSAGTPGP